MLARPLYLGDLLRLLAQLPNRAEWAHAAEAMGYEWLEPTAPQAKADENVACVLDDKPASSAPSGMQREPEPIESKPVYWRIAADFTEPRANELPDWLVQAQSHPAPPGAFETSGAFPLPRPQPLVPPGRLSRFLRQQLAEHRAGQEIDLDWAVQRLARGQPLQALRRRELARWPRQLDVVTQSHAALGPLRADLRAVERQLQRQLGPRMRALRAPQGPHALTDARGHPQTLSREGARVLVLGDAGEYLDRPAFLADWQHWATHREQSTGARPLLMAPLPRRRLSAATARAFDVALLDESARLQVVSVAQANKAQGTALDAGSGAPPDPHANARRVLMGLLAGISSVPLELVRLLRLDLRREGVPGADVACEVELMVEPGMAWDGVFCRVLPQAEAAVLAELPQRLANPAVLRRRLARMDRLARVLPPPLIAERQHTLLRHLREPLRAALGEAALRDAQARAQRLWGWMAEALQREKHKPTPGLAAYLQDLGRFNPALIGSGPPELQGAWAAATPRLFDPHRPARLPPGLKLESLGWLASRSSDALALELKAAGRSALLRLVPQANAAPGAWLQNLPGALHIGFETVSWVAGEPEQVQAQQHVRVSDELSLTAVCQPNGPLQQRWRLHVGPRRLDVQPFHKPPWAAAIHNERGTWFAELDTGRRLRWVPQREFVVHAPSQGLASHRLLHACWWDDAEYLAFAGDDGTFRCPAWANAGHGTDEHGYWAAFRIGEATQTMRFIQPGEFMMGSPVDETERFPIEEQHPVLLSRGFWLADTACTQQLWFAVTGNNPSEFNVDRHNPVERVAWNEVHHHFLGRLRQLAPGLQLVLPTEAQWEYAARCAGHATKAFSWGDDISTAQANYNGNYPLREGDANGKPRGETMPVKSFEPNSLGLWQMHGNVNEWVQDAFGDYPAEGVADPEGPKAGVGARRVLRGGSWFEMARNCRSAMRFHYVPVRRRRGTGLRFARGLPSSGSAEPVGARGAGVGGEQVGEPRPGTDAPGPAARQRGRGFGGL